MADSSKFIYILLTYFSVIAIQIPTTKIPYASLLLPGFHTRIHAALRNVMIARETCHRWDWNPQPPDKIYPLTVALFINPVNCM